MIVVNDRQASAETALLLLCAASDGSPRSADEIRSAAGAVTSWPELYALSIRHAIVPIVEQELRSHASSIVPPEVAAQLRDATQKTAMQSLMLAGELVTVVQALVERGVDALPFKGPTLASLVYGSLGLRQYQDLDLLVHLGDLDLARAVMISLGFAPVLSMSEAQRVSLVLSGHHEQFVNSETGTYVELHWSLNNRTLTRASFEHHWWENRQPASLGGVAMRTLGVEQLLLYLCMHGGKHSWARLSWLCDFQRALRSYPDAVWEKIWRLAESNGSARMVAIGLGLVEALFDGRELTEPALRGRRSDARADSLVALFSSRLRGENAHPSTLDFAVQLRSRERRRDRLRYTWHVLANPHPADVALLGLPRGLYGVYHIARPVRLLWKHVFRRVGPTRVMV